MPRRSISNTGLAFGLLSGAAFSTSGSFASSLIAVGWTPGAAVAARLTVAAVVLTLPALLLLRSRGVTASAMRGAVLYGVVAVAAGQLCYFNAVEHLSVAVALLIEYSGILLVIVWMWGRHGHRPRQLTIAGGSVALAGLVLVLDLVGSHQFDAVGVLWALGAAVALAVYFVMSATTDDSMPPLVMAWGGLAVGAATLGGAALVGVLPMRATRADVTLLGTKVNWLVPVLGLALVAAAFAYVAGIMAARLLGAKVASFVGLTEVLFAVVFAWLLLDQRLDLAQGVGAALVIAGIALVRLDELHEPVLVQQMLPEPVAAGDCRGESGQTTTAA